MKTEPAPGHADVRLALLGDGIAHSLSPLLHTHAGAQHELSVSYELLEPRQLGQSFEEVLADCQRRGLTGVNVTLPYKERAARVVALGDDASQRIGAVNTITFTSEQPLGYNTDHSAFLACYPATQAQRPGVVCLLGTGGVGRAVAFALAELGATELRLVNRTRQRAEALAGDLTSAFPALGVAVYDRAEEAARGAEGLVNCTAVGMVNVGGTPLPREAMGGARWAFDAVYAPAETRFLAAAAAEGLALIRGGALFLHQGVGAWRRFTGKPLDVPRLRAELITAHPDACWR